MEALSVPALSTDARADDASGRAGGVPPVEGFSVDGTKQYSHERSRSANAFQDWAHDGADNRRMRPFQKRMAPTPFPPTPISVLIDSLSLRPLPHRIAYEDGFGCRSCGCIHAKKDAIRTGRTMTITKSCRGVSMGTETVSEETSSVASTANADAEPSTGSLNKQDRCRSCPLLWGRAAWGNRKWACRIRRARILDTDSA